MSELTVQIRLFIELFPQVIILLPYNTAVVQFSRFSVRKGHMLAWPENKTGPQFMENNLNHNLNHSHNTGLKTVIFLK